MYKSIILFLVLSVGVRAEVHEFTLQEAVERAVNHNRQLVAACDSLTKSQLGLQSAKNEFGIKIHPSGDLSVIGGGEAGNGPAGGVGLDVSKKMPSGTKITIKPDIARSQNFWYSNARASISQPLIRGLGREYNLSGYRTAQFNVRNSVRSVYLQQVQVIVRTIQAVYEVVKAEHGLELNRQAHDQVHGLHRSATLKEKMGLFDSVDSYRAETELQKAQDSLRAAESTLIEAKESLRDVLALPIGSEVAVNAPLNYGMFEFKEDDAVEQALAKRIEIEMAEDALAEACRQLKVAKRNLWPDLNLVLKWSNCGKANEFVQSCTARRTADWSAGFSTSTDLTPTAARAAICSAEIAVNTARTKVEEEKSKVAVEVAKAIRTLDRAKEKIASQDDQIITSEGQMRLSKMKFERGMVNNFDVIGAQKTMQGAYNNQLNAVIEHIVGEYKLLVAVGLLADKPCLVSS